MGTGTTERIQHLFSNAKRELYDFSGLPSLVRLRVNPLQDKYDSRILEQWGSLQSKFIRWTSDRSVFTEENVRDGKRLYDEYFAEHGHMTGCVLDIGGGWGLFRQWWAPEGADDAYIVHDPGVERFLAGAHPEHRRVYADAFSRPMTFVEGFGEDLPYNEAFVVGLIAAAIDHCVDPTKVLAETYRCLRPGGQLILLQQCDSLTSARPASTRLRRKLWRVLRRLRSPRELIRILYYQLTYRDPHLHHFTIEDLTARMKAVGYSDVRSVPVAGSEVQALTGRKVEIRA
jgi:ubiquinone/menaquinone biosynthesis C-methylase UbiE